MLCCAVDVDAGLLCSALRCVALLSELDTVMVHTWRGEARTQDVGARSRVGVPASLPLPFLWIQAGLAGNEAGSGDERVDDCIPHIHTQRGASVSHLALGLAALLEWECAQGQLTVLLLESSLGLRTAGLRGPNDMSGVPTRTPCAMALCSAHAPTRCCCAAQSGCNGPVCSGAWLLLVPGSAGKRSADRLAIAPGPGPASESGSG